MRLKLSVMFPVIHIFIKHWSSVDEFKRVQRKWAVAGVCVAVVAVFLVLIS